MFQVQLGLDKHRVTIPRDTWSPLGSACLWSRLQDRQGPSLQPQTMFLFAGTQALRDIAVTVNEVLNELTGLVLISLMPDLNLCNSINLVS